MEFFLPYICRLVSISKSGCAYLLLLIFAVACTRTPLRNRTEALRSASRPFVADDLGAKDFLTALDSHVAFLEKAKLGDFLQFGPRTIAVKPYVAKLRELIEWSKGQSALSESIWDKISAEYEFLEVYGGKSWGNILLTSYFEPEIHGSLQKTEKYSQPLYGAPKDIIDVAIGNFDERFSEVGVMKGRMARDEKLGKQRLFPYYSRAQIDGPEAVLRGRGLELGYTHPIDAFFMQIQGSGTLLLDSGEKLRLGFADQNGHRYHSIGKFLTDVIPLQEMSLFRLESYLHTLSVEEARAILFKNPSFVFFRPLEGPAVTSIGNSVFAGRTIATDPRYFPKGALAFLQFRRPVFTADTGDEVREWQEVSRFVFDQDTGGAIRGGGRADLFWGTGDEAKRFAGVIKDDRARLYYLVPKEL